MLIGCCADIDNYHALESIGFDFIELAGSKIAEMDGDEFERIRKCIMKGQLPCKSFNAFLPPKVKMAGEGYDYSVLKKYLESVLERGSYLGISSVGVGSPPSRTLPDGFDRKKAVRQITDFLKLASEIASKYSIKVLLEPLTKTQTNFINTTAEALEILSLLDTANVGLLIDLYHFMAEGECPESIDVATAGLTGHIHIADLDGRTFPIPGNAESYKLLIDRLLDLGYKRNISIEGNYSDFKSEAEVGFDVLNSIIGQRR